MKLPDSSFLIPGKRLFPYKDSAGRVDSVLVEGAMMDIVASNLPAPVKANLMARTKAISKRTVEAELWSYIRMSEPKEHDMSKDIFNRMQEAIVRLIKTRVAVDRKRRQLAEPDAVEETEPVEEAAAESMQESYVLPIEALSEVAALEQGVPRVIRNCTFIQAGLNVPKTRRWDASLLEGGLDCFDGSLCYIDHPADGMPRSLRALAGYTRHARFDKATDSVIGDIELLDNEAADYVISLFGNETIRNSGAVGLSVLWEGGTFESAFEEYGNRTIQVPTKLSGKCQVDFVANPTAHGIVGTL